MDAPIAKKVPHHVHRHGTTRRDDYNWLRDANWKAICEQGQDHFDNPEIRQYIEAENRYTDYVMRDTEVLQQQIYAELLSHTQEDDTSAPIKKGPFYYYTKTQKGCNYPIYCRKRAEDRASLAQAEEQVWLDVNALATENGSPQFQVIAAEVSPNHDYVAYSYNTTGSVCYTIVVRELASGKALHWRVQDVLGGIVWANDNRHVLFVTRDPVKCRGQEIKCLDIQSGEIQLIYSKPEQYDAMHLHVAETCSKQWITIFIGDHTSNEELLLDANNIALYFEGAKNRQAPKIVQPLKQGLLYSVEPFGDTLLIHTNNEAENFRVMKASFSEPGMAHWAPLIPNQSDTYIASVSICQTLAQSRQSGKSKSCYLVCQITNIDKALPGIMVYDLETAESFLIEMPDEAYCLYFRGIEEFVSDTFVYYYQSPVHPYQSVEFNLLTQAKQILKVKTTPNYDASLYTTKREYAKGHDGVDIPVTLVYKKATPVDGSAPCFVEGYGSYGSGGEAYFSPNKISLLDRGFVCVVTHVRGGSDRGYRWYLDGKLDKKKNTFFDFISTCEFLISRGYTSKGNIIASGASAGGLLVGAVANMRPDLFRTVIAYVPFVDLMNSMEDVTLPLTEGEWNEWGNPLEDKDAYEYMLSYSPYDNVVSQHYPHLLFHSGISDEQVAYWEPAKMVAKLRALKKDDNLLLLKVQMTAGHMGVSGRYDMYRQLAFDFAFCFKTFGINR